MIKSIHPVLAARDVATSVAFFHRLGFATTFLDSPESPRYAAVVRDGCELHLQWQDASNWQGAGDRPTFRFLVSDVDRLFQEFQASGVAPDPSVPASPWAVPGDTPWGTREFHLRDPGGNGLHFYCPV